MREVRNGIERTTQTEAEGNGNGNLREVEDEGAREVDALLHRHWQTPG